MSRQTARSVLNPPASIAVIGGGQLGRMFVQAAQRLGYRAGVMSQTIDGPASQVAEWRIQAPPDSLPGLRDLSERAAGVTVEFENVSAPALRWLERAGVVVRPGWKTLWVSQNRLREKTFLERRGFPLAPWRPVRTLAELIEAERSTGFPMILKTAASGYDGKGQIKVDRSVELEDAWTHLRRVPCVAEAWIPFAAEVSAVSVRGYDGEARAYPIAWNRHRRHILDSTVMPAPVGPVVATEARKLALDVSQALGTIGMLTVEFFLGEDGSLMINELAPRPHNSGHLTIEAAIACQFEQQVRALCGLPLGSTDLASPAAMVNLLGDLWKDGEPNWERAYRLDPGVKIHLYGKGAPAIGRKMGHLTVLGDDPASALDRALAARDALTRR